MNDDSQIFEFREIPCPACNQDVPKFRGWRGGEAHHSGAGVKTAIVRCRNCSHQYPNPMPFPKVSLEEIYINADEYFTGHDIENKKQNGLRLMKEYEQKLGRRGKFLDVGCGVGELLWAAGQSGWDAEGIDPSKDFVEAGQQKLGVSARVCSLEDAKFPDEYFDAIAMSGIIEHLYSPFEALEEIYRILKPGGWFWFNAPNEDALYTQFGNLYVRLQGKDWVVATAPTFPPYHVQGFNPRSVRSLLKRTNFELQELELFGEICEQTGQKTLRKKLEYYAGKGINWVGKGLNKGSYMNIWVKKV